MRFPLSTWLETETFFTKVKEALEKMQEQCSLPEAEEPPSHVQVDRTSKWNRRDEGCPQSIPTLPVTEEVQDACRASLYCLWQKRCSVPSEDPYTTSLKIWKIEWEECPQKIPQMPQQSAFVGIEIWEALPAQLTCLGRQPCQHFPQRT